MAYNNYIPQFYPQQDYSRAAYIPQTQSNPQNAITCVQGENAAKSYPIGVVLMQEVDLIWDHMMVIAGMEKKR